MSQEKIQMPSSTAGLTRYFDDYKSKVEIPPMVVVGICAAVAVLVIILNLYVN